MERGVDRETGYYLSREQEDREAHKAWMALVVWVLAMLLVGTMETGDRERSASAAREAPPLAEARG